MLNGDKLESFYFLSYHGNEGFLDELIEEYDNGNIKVEDFEQLADICEENGETEKAEEIRKALEEAEAEE
jgi:Ca2+-binding EF-hand superfamily protein